MRWNIFFSILIICIISILGISIKNNLTTPEPIIVIEKSPIPHEYLGEFDTTHYSHTGNRCSTGVYPKAGRTVAVDPKKIPYGTYLYIENYGVRITEDSGSDIKNNRLDIFVDSHNEAIQLGRKKVKVWVLTNPKK